MGVPRRPGVPGSGGPSGSVPRSRTRAAAAFIVLLLAAGVLLQPTAAAAHPDPGTAPRWVTRGSFVSYDNWWRFAEPEPSLIGGSDWDVLEVTDDEVVLLHTVSRTPDGRTVYNIPEAAGEYRVRRSDRTILQAPNPTLVDQGFWLWAPGDLEVGRTVFILGIDYLVEEQVLRHDERAWTLNAEGETTLADGQTAEIRTTMYYSVDRHLLVDQLDYIVGDSVFTSTLLTFQDAARALPLTTGQLALGIPLVAALLVGGHFVTLHKRKQVEGGSAGGATAGDGDADGGGDA